MGLGDELNCELRQQGEKVAMNSAMRRCDAMRCDGIGYVGNEVEVGIIKGADGVCCTYEDGVCMML